MVLMKYLRSRYGFVGYSLIEGMILVDFDLNGSMTSCLWDRGRKDVNKSCSRTSSSPE